MRFLPSYANSKELSANHIGGQVLKSSLCIGTVSAQPSLLAHIHIWGG